MSAFGLHCTAYAGPESGVREKASYVLEQGDIRFVVSGGLGGVMEDQHQEGNGPQAPRVTAGLIALGHQDVRAQG